MPTETTEIRQMVFIDAKPVQVYDAIVNPKKHSEFTGAPATGEAVVGGEFTAYDEYITGKYVELQPARKIVADWQTAEWPFDNPPSRLEISFEPKDGGTEVTMLQTSVPVKQAPNYETGWKDFYWEPLMKYFAKEQG